MIFIDHMGLLQALKKHVPAVKLSFTSPAAYGQQEELNQGWFKSYWQI